jgi:uncharacterized RDD family membrane protein YckC
MQWADDVRIETPEQIDVALEVAGLGSRFLAKAIDWLVKWGTILVAGLLVAIVVAFSGETPFGKAAPVLLVACLVALFYAFFLGFDVYFEVRQNGQTPGKRRAGIRVIREGGSAVDFRSACIRNLLGMADFLPAFYLLGSFLILLTRRGQRLGDLAAGTLVIRERALEAPVEPAAEIEQLASRDFTFTPTQLAACSPEDRYILRSFFQRYRQLEAGSREKLARRLAEGFLQKTSYQPTPSLEKGPVPARFLASLYRDLETQAQHGG